MILIPVEPTIETFAPQLPVELWLRIFRFVTSTRIISLPVQHEPFQSSHDNTALLDAALRDKCTLTLVCKQWRLLASDMLYEDIRLGQGIAALHAALDQPIDSSLCGHRHRVRRIVLPYKSTEMTTCHSPPALDLLALLPHIEVLVRPPICPSYVTFPFDFPTTVPALSTLRRLEWAFDPSGAAPRTGGINALSDVLRVAPALELLVLVGSMPFASIYQRPPPPLKHLTTLRLQDGAGTCPFVARQATYWKLPALENIIVEGPARAETLEALWEAFGGQVRMLEIELAEYEEVQKIVGACAAIETLYLHVQRRTVASSTSSRDEDDGRCQYVHDSLRRVGLCVDNGERAGEWDDSTWRTVGIYVGQFGEGCPALHEIELYVPDVRVAAQSREYHALREMISSRGRQLLLRSLHT
jgi:F-box-like